MAWTVQGNIKGPKGDAGDPDAGVQFGAQQVADFAFALAAAGTCTPCNAAGAIVGTIPTNATVAFPIGTVLYIAQRGAGAASFAGAAGVTVNTPNGAATSAVGDWRVAVQVAADEWDVQ